jgi:hypothetical protein
MEADVHLERGLGFEESERDQARRIEGLDLQAREERDAECLVRIPQGNLPGRESLVRVDEAGQEVGIQIEGGESVLEVRIDRGKVDVEPVAQRDRRSDRRECQLEYEPCSPAVADADQGFLGRAQRRAARTTRPAIPSDNPGNPADP